MSRNFENWLKAYLNYTAHSEAPDTFHFWTGVVTVAGALQRKVWNDQRFFQWTPNFYVVLVAPPGVATKSTTARIGQRLLRQVDGVVFGPQSMTWQGLMSCFKEAAKLIPYGNSMLPMSCLTCVVSELGTFLRLESGELVDALTAWWDGQKEPFDRGLKEESTSVENLWLNVIGCVTPGWMRKNYPETLVDAGLTSRIIFVYADEKRHLEAYPAERLGEEEFKEVERKLVEDLQKIGELLGEYKLTKEAIEWGRDWYKDLWTNRPLHMAGDRYSGYRARKQGHIHKLAMVIAAAQRDELVITLEDLQTSNRIITALERDMTTVFQSIGVSDSSRNVTEILAFVRAYGEVAQMSLWRNCMTMMDPKDFQEAIDAAVRAGYLRITQRGGDIFYKALTASE